MKKFWLIFNVITSLALSVLCGFYFVYKTQELLSNLILQMGLYCIILCVSLFLSYALHEVGHLLFGKIFKMGVKFNSNSIFTSAFSCSVNPQTDKNIKPRFLITVLGGLIFNLLLLLIGSLGFDFDVLVWLCPIVPASFYVLFLNILPFEYEGGKTDGLVALEVLKSEDTAKVLLNILTVQGMLNCGKKLEEIDKSLLFEVPQLPEDDVNFIYLTQLRAEYYAAIGDSENSAKYQQRYEQLKIYL